MSELIDAVSVVFWRNVTSLSWLAVAAESHSAAAYSVIPASRLVNGAGFICDVVMMDPLVCVICITAMAAIVFLFAGNQNLGSYVNVRPSSFALNFDSIRERRCCGLSPARAAVLRDVLVFYVGQVVDSIYTTPVK